MGDGGYSAKNGAREAPQHRLASTGTTLGDDFPMICETCLGPNPYVRMSKLPYGYKLCKISNLPYQAFKWKAGPGGRYKETMVSYVVAAERNICQTCLLDMKYGLPVGVRDSLLSQMDNEVALPRSNVGQQYHYEQQALMIADGQLEEKHGMHLDVASIVASRQLDRFSRIQQVAEARSKTAFRNLPKLCSFWLNGTCSRVLQKTCPFRPCCGEFIFPEIAGSHRELCGKLVEALKTDGPIKVMKELDQTTRDAIVQAQKGNRDDAIRKRVSGEDDLSKKYLGKMKSMNMQLDPPTDESIVTLWLGNIEGDITEDDVRSEIYPYGQIASIHMVRSAKCAFVEYIHREAAESAASQLYNALMVKGRAISVNWARPRASSTNENTGTSTSDEASVTMILPPPGLEKAPISAYSLPGLTASSNNPPPPPPLPSSTIESNHATKKQKTSSSNNSTGVPMISNSVASYFSGYGDDDDNEDEVTPTPLPTTSHTAAVAGKKIAKSATSQQYPSMNPTRMGAAHPTAHV